MKEAFAADAHRDDARLEDAIRLRAKAGHGRMHDHGTATFTVFRARP